ncbi:MAG: hypothetical protein AAFX93_19810 [Verrucomicrobiota bacterium]
MNGRKAKQVRHLASDLVRQNPSEYQDEILHVKTVTDRKGVAYRRYQKINGWRKAKRAALELLAK